MVQLVANSNLPTSSNIQQKADKDYMILYVLYVSDHDIISQFWNGEVFHDQKSGSWIFPTF